MNSFSSFDAAVYVLMFVAVVTGFNAGLLRSVASIVGYLSAMPIAVATTSLISPARADPSDVPWAQNSLVFFGVFLVTGIVLGGLLRTAINETVGARIGVPDRLAGSLLGVVRVAFVAVTMVLIFDRLIPPDRQPAFLSESQLRPILSLAGQKGLKSLPPEITAFVDQLKKDRQM
jgi:membrane protein required for colicin V production